MPDRNIRFTTTVPLTADDITLHRTFMDTVGRPTLHLSAINVVDEWREKDLIVTYEYPWTAGYRKPLTVAAAVGSLFVASWIVGNIDTRIAGRKS